MKNVFTPIVEFVTKLPRRRFLWYVFVCSLLLRVSFVFWNPTDRTVDLYEHGDIAHNLYTGHGFAMHWPYSAIASERQQELKRPPMHEGAFLPPVNPYLLAGFYVCFGENQTALLFYTMLMCIVSALVPVAIYALTRYFASERVSRLAALIAGINMFAVFGVLTYTGSSLYQLAAVVSIYSLLVALKKKRISYYALVGLLSGVLTLLRSEYFLFGPILISVSAFLFKERTSVRLQYIAVALSLHSLVIAPWVIRNYNLFDRFVPVLSHPWYEVWRGNNPRANGTVKDAAGMSIWVDPLYDRQIVSAMDALPYDTKFEVAADSIFKTEVVKFWRTDPIHALGLGLKKMLMFMTSDFHSGPIVNISYALFSFAVFALAMVGIIGGLRKKMDASVRAAAIVFALFISYYLTLTFFTVMLPRYQIYVLNTLLPMTAAGFAVTRSALGGRQT